MIPARFQPVLDELAPLARRFRAAGFRLYLVGGTVRDLMLGRDNVDVDCTTDARPDQIKACVQGLASAVWTQGERFGTIGARIGEHSVEITTHRAEAYSPESRKPDVAFADGSRGLATSSVWPPVRRSSWKVWWDLMPFSCSSGGSAAHSASGAGSRIR